jgi:D-hydroxyproline dehydrogenase subunit gamma
MSHIAIHVNGSVTHCAEGTSVAAALLNAGVSHFRAGAGGDARAPLCGMGICHECRVTIDGTAHVRACMTQVRAGMEVTTGAAQR